MAYKCPKTLGNKGLSGISAIWKNASATLLQLGMEKAQKGMVAGGCEVCREERCICDAIKTEKKYIILTEG